MGKEKVESPAGKEKTGMRQARKSRAFMNTKIGKGSGAGHKNKKPRGCGVF